MGPTVEGVFRILDQASPTFDKIMAKAKGADKAVGKVGKTLDEVAAKAKADTKVMKEGIEGVGKQSDETTTQATIGWTEFEKKVHSATRGITGDAAKLKAALKAVEGKYNIDITGKGDLIASTVLARQLKQELNAVQREQAKTAAAQLGLAATGGGGGGPGLASRIGGALTPFGLLPSIAAAAFAPIVDLTGAVGALAGSLGEAAIGAGALAVGGIGIGGVGLAGVISVVIPAIKSISELKKAQDAYNESVQLYGRNSTQAVSAAKKLLIAQKSAGPMNGFNPAQLTALGKAWQRLTKEGQGAFFGMLGRNLKRTRRLLPDLAESANRSMKAAAGGVDVFMQRLDGPEFRHFLDRMTDAFVHNVRPISRILSNTGRVFGRIAVATIPSINEMVASLEDTTEGWIKSTNNAGELRDHVEGLVSQTRDWFRLLDAAWELIKSAFGAGAGEGQGMVRSMTKQFREWDKWIVTHPGKVKGFFRNAREGAGDLFRAIGSFVPTLSNFYDAFRPISGVIGTVVERLNSLKIGNVTALTGILGYLTARRIRNSLLGGGGNIMGSRGPAAPGSLANPIAVVGLGGAGGRGGGARGGAVVGAGSQAAARVRSSRAGKAAATVAAAGALRFPRAGAAVEKGLSKAGGVGRAIQGLGKIPLLGAALFGLGVSNPEHGNSIQSRLATGLEFLDPTALLGAFGIGPERGVLNAGFSALFGAVGGDLNAAPAEIVAMQAKQVGVPAAFAFRHAKKGKRISWILNQWINRKMHSGPGGSINRTLFKSFEDNLARLAEKTDDTRDKVNRRTGDMAETSAKNVRKLGDVFGSVMSYIQTTTDRGLKAMGAKPTGWTVMDVPGAKGPPTPARFKQGSGRNALGGFIPGKGKSDTVPVPGGYAAPGEAWIANGPTQMRINRMLRPYGTSLEKEIRRERHPHNIPLPQNHTFGGRARRFARGGRTGTMPSSFPDAMGALPGLDALAWVLKQKFGLSVTSGLRPGAITTSGNPSDHGWGGAIDVSNGVTTPQMDAAHAWLQSTLGPAIKQMLYRTMVGGNHYNHIHVALQPSYARNPGAVMRLISGGGAGMAGMRGMMAGRKRVPKVPLKMLQGAKTGPQAIAQGGINKVTAAANELLAKKAKSGMRGMAMPRGGGVPATVARVLARAGFNRVAIAGILGNAYAESSYRPSATGYGGGGLWGFTSSPYSLADLQAFAANQGRPWTSAALQTQFLIKHIPGSLKARLNAMSSPEAAAKLFMTDWERPGIPRLDVRESAARKAFNSVFNRGGRTARTGTMAAPAWAGWHARGGRFKVDRPTLFGVGEGGRSETVQITRGGDNRSQRQYVVHIAKIENHRKGDIRKILEEEFDKLGDDIALAGDRDD